MGRINNIFKRVLLQLFVCLLCLEYTPVVSQSGRVYEFLNLPSSARTTAIGGYGIPDLESDIDMAGFYPSLINESLHQNLSLNFINYFDDINSGTAIYSHTFERYGSFTGRVHFINYGRFIEADETGNHLGTFGAGEYAIIVGWGRQISDNFHIGSNLKIVGSDFYEYSSFGLATDVSGSYFDHDQLFAASLLFRNIGRQITTYHSGNNEPLPFEIIASASKKLLNAPFRLFAVAHNLQKYDLTYDRQPGTNYQSFQHRVEDETNIGDIADILMHHLILGMEFLPTDNLSFRMGYNYRRRQELKVETKVSTVGFSWGLGVKVSKFHFSYGRSIHHLSGTPNHITVAFNVDDVFGGRVPANQNNQ